MIDCGSKIGVGFRTFDNSGNPYSLGFLTQDPSKDFASMIVKFHKFCVERGVAE